MTPIHVLLVDGHPLFRQGVASVLACDREFEVVGEAGDGHEALEMARELMPDVILMDISLPVMEGPEATRRIKAEMPYVKIVLLAVSDTEHCLFEAIKSGAETYLLKETEPQVLYGALQRVVRGDAPVPRAMAARLLEEFSGQRRGPSPMPAAGLTVREREVLEHMARGRTDKEVAAALAIAEGTVKNHLQNVLEKLHLENRAQAATYSPRESPMAKPLEDPAG